MKLFKITGGLIILVFLLGLGVFLSGRFISTGSIFRSCNYTEERITIPQELSEATVVLARDTYVVKNTDKEFECLPELGQIDRELVAPKWIDESTGATYYYTSQNRVVDPIAKGKEFKIIQIIGTEKHGISTIDSGSGPSVFLILEDSDGSRYKVATVMLGINDGEEYLAIIPPHQKYDATNVQLLSASSFDYKFGSDNKIELLYKGPQSERSEKELTRSEPMWKQLIAEIENGGRFLITVSLREEDANRVPITLSEREEERERQVKDIQDRFLNSLPNTLSIEELEKNESWPTVSMRANKELLRYLGENQQRLRIESINKLIKVDETGVPIE